MSRKLTKQTIKPVLSYVDGLNGGYYHFTLDTYQGHTSFTGGVADDLNDCYIANFKPDSFERIYDRPLDEYALSLETGVVYRLSDKTPVMTVNLRTSEVTS